MTVKDALFASDTIEVSLPTSEIVQVSLGATHVHLSVDAAYELQYRLAGLLAGMELAEAELSENAPEFQTQENFCILSGLAASGRNRRRLNS